MRLYERIGLRADSLKIYESIILKKLQQFTGSIQEKITFIKTRDSHNSHKAHAEYGAQFYSAVNAIWHVLRFQKTGKKYKWLGHIYSVYSAIHLNPPNQLLACFACLIVCLFVHLLCVHFLFVCLFNWSFVSLFVCQLVCLFFSFSYCCLFVCMVNCCLFLCLILWLIVQLFLCLYIGKIFGVFFCMFCSVFLTRPFFPKVLGFLFDFVGLVFLLFLYFFVVVFIFFKCFFCIFVCLIVFFSCLCLFLC